MQYIAITKDSGLFIPNLNQFLPNQWVTLEISQMKPQQQSNHEEYSDSVVGILKNVDGVEFQNMLREE